jgi:hypothetical protein
MMKHSTTSVFALTIICTVSALTLSSIADAGITTVSTRTEAHANARFIEMKKEVVLPKAKPTEISYLTDTRFIYTAPSPAEIEDVAIVQWIRGCVFTSDRHGEKHLSISREHFGRIVPFKHSHWQIDSESTDPVYSSYDGYGRFALLRWNDDPADTDPETATYYAKAKPSHGTVFVTDLPGTAFLASKNEAQNVSLEFQTCLFNTADLPKTTTPDGLGIDNAKALWCVSWDHKFVYDFKAGKMLRPAQIDPFCGDTSR